MKARKNLLSPLAIGLLATAGLAQTVTVTTLEDDSDFGGAQQVADLPGSDGKVSFREALTATNNTPGPQTVEFAIPPSEWWLVGEYALLRLEDGVFLISDDETTVDFSTQEDFSGDTNPDGMEVGIYGLQPNGWGSPAIIVQAGDCVIRGLGPVHQRGASVSIWSGHRNRVVGCVTGSVEIDPYPGTSTGNVIGGTAPEDANVLGSASILCGGNDNQVIGNRIRAVSVVGSRYCTSNPYPLRNRIGGPTPEERNVLTGAGYYGEEGFPVGQNVLVSWAKDTLVEGNYIGITGDGTTRVPQVGPTGIRIYDALETTVRGNVIAGHWVEGTNHYNNEFFGQAMLVTAANADNVGTVIEDNLIGTDASGENAILTLNGVVLSPLVGSRQVRATRIGGTDPGQGNVIAFTERTGIAVSSGTPDAEISGNAIQGNGLLGIDLGTFQGFDGVTFNDPGDVDVNGGNELQNFPVIDSVLTNGWSVQIGGVLNSTPFHTYRLEFFANRACDPSGHGEGEVFLGSREVTTDASGNAFFHFRLEAGVGAGAFVTSTATDLITRATSEFSACVTARSAYRLTPSGGAWSTFVFRP